MLKKILAGMIAVTAMLSFASCTENENDDSSKAAKKSSDSSAIVAEESSSKAEEETTTTPTTAQTEQPTETETTTTTEKPEEPAPVANGDVYECDDFSISYDSSKWTKFDPTSVDSETVKNELGIDLGSFSTQIDCFYSCIDDPTTSFNIVASAAPGITPDIDTSDYLDYFSKILGSASDKITIESTESTKIGSNNAIHLKISLDAGDGNKIIEEQYDVFGDGKMIAATFTSSSETFDNHAADFKAVLDTLKIK